MPFVPIAIVNLKAAIEVPTGIAGIFRMPKTHRKASEAIGRYRAPLANEPIESVMEYRRIRYLLKGSPSIAGQPDDGLGPCCRIMGTEGDVPPQDGAALLHQFPRKRAVDTDEPIPNKLLYLAVSEPARIQTIIIRHEIFLNTTTQPSMILKARISPSP